ncbi:MAG: hypothetical protein VW935_06305 [Novosphingobium sp.]
MIEDHVLDLVAARQLVREFQSTIRSKSSVQLGKSLETAKRGIVSSFANGVEREFSAVRNAIVSPWPTSQTEGQSQFSAEILIRNRLKPCYSPTGGLTSWGISLGG